MSNTYNIKFSDFRQRPDFEEMFGALQSSFKQCGIDFYLVGATVKNLWIVTIHKAGQSRVTKDFDIAALIPHQVAFNQLKQHLITHYPFTASKENAFTLIWKEKYPVDIMPFGEIEDANANVRVAGSGFVNISVPGFAEVYQNGLATIQIENKTNFKICSLTGIVILKLLAWNDRPESRVKDITDIGEIMYEFFEMHLDLIWDNYSYLFDSHGDNMKELANVVIGLEIKKILSGNLDLLEKIISIIEADMAQQEYPVLSVTLAKHFDNTIDENTQLFKCILSGLKK